MFAYILNAYRHEKHFKNSYSSYCYYFYGALDACKTSL
ncbi:hypothetical protein M110_0037 [Bacteroides fragilis str. 3397 N3]|nr:hypothetical protein M110_0037 [Bacteroides fragilis str. 3397 N3]